MEILPSLVRNILYSLVSFSTCKNSGKDSISTVEIGCLRAKNLEEKLFLRISRDYLRNYLRNITSSPLAIYSKGEIKVTLLFGIQFTGLVHLSDNSPCLFYLIFYLQILFLQNSDSSDFQTRNSFRGMFV